MLHPTFLITPAQRLAAAEQERSAEAAGVKAVAGLIRLARQAESFPNSYTSAAVELSERVIRAAANSQPVALMGLVTELARLMEAGEWYR